MKNSLLATLLLVILMSSLYSQSVERYGMNLSDSEMPVGPEVNDTAPDFTAKNQHGKTQSLSST